MTGLVGWWPLHENSGNTARDLSGNGNHGTLNGGVTQGVAGRGGLQGIYCSDGGVETSSISLDIAGSHGMTFSTWVRSRWSSTDSNNRTLIRWKSDSNNNFGFRWDGSDSEWQWGWSNDGLSGPSDSYQNKWVHYAGTVTPDGTLSGYINGEQVNSKSVGSAVGTASASLGYRSSTSGFELGSEMCDTRLYNRALSPQEIQTLYKWGNGDYASPPRNSQGGVHYYNFNNSNANDQWGSLDGTLKNSPTYQSSGGPRSDGAYKFNGSDQWIDLGKHNLGTESHTLSAWIKPLASHDNFERILTFDYDSGTSHGSKFAVNNDGSFDYIWQTSDGSRNDKDNRHGGKEVTGVWTHLAGIYDANEDEGYFYVNGTKRQERTTNWTGWGDGNSGDAQVAKMVGSDRYWNGIIDDVRIYNRALDPHEVFQLYQWGTRGRDMRKLTVNSRGDQ